MNLFTRIVCLIMLTAALMLVFFDIEASSQSTGSLYDSLETAERISGDKFRLVTRTDKGATVISVNEPSREFLGAIDSGLSELFEKAREKGYRKGLNHGNYHIFVAVADRDSNAKGSYSPDIAVNAAQYAGSKYDKGGFIYAAGFVISNEDNSFLMAEHERDFERVARLVRFEGEHILLFHNDRDLYYKTRDHSKGGSHPIL